MVALPRLDDVTSFLTGLGTASDRSTSMRMQPRQRLTSQELHTIWEQKGLGVLLSTLPAEAMTREWFTLNGLPEGFDVKAIDSAQQDLRVKHSVTRLASFGSHWGGSILGAAIDDGLPSHWPLDLDRINSIKGLFVLQREEVMPISRYGEPEAYMIANGANAPVEGRIIHATRCIKYCGPVDLPDHRRREEQYWSLSAVERVYDEARKMWSAHGYAEGVLHDLILDVFTVPGLQEAVLSGKGELLKARVRLFAGLKSVFRAMAIDGGSPDGKRKPETYVQKSRAVSGVPQLVDVFLPALIAASGIPRSILFGDSYGGLNSGGNDGEWKSWDSRVKSWQGDLLTPWVTWILNLIFAAKQGPTGGVVPETYTIEHRALRQATPAEQADIDEKRANTHRTYWEMGVLTSEQIQEQVFVKGRERISLDSLELPGLPAGSQDEVDNAQA